MPYHVSRETAPRVPAPPLAAVRVFGAALPLAREYAEILATDGVVRGLIGPREVPRLWDRHLLNCVVVAPLIPRGARVCDVGSGAGLPGLVIALARPDLQVILLESLQRRTVFLTECAARLGLPHVQVIRGRAEDQAGQLAVDVVVARAVAPLTRLVEWSLPLLRSGGMLLAIKGASAEQEVAAAAPRLVRLGAFEWDVRRVGGPDVDPPTTVVRIAAGERSSAGRPGRKSTRRAGVRSRSVGRSTGGAPRRGEG